MGRTCVFAICLALLQGRSQPERSGWAITELGGGAQE